MSQPERDWIWAWLLLMNLRMKKKKIIQELSLAYAMELETAWTPLRRIWPG